MYRVKTYLCITFENWRHRIAYISTETLGHYRLNQLSAKVHALLYMACRFSIKLLSYAIIVRQYWTSAWWKMVNFYCRTFFFFVSAQPWVEKSNIWQVYWLSEFWYQPVLEKLKKYSTQFMGYGHFHIICLGLASVKENSHLASSLATSCRYHIIKIFPIV